MVQYGLNLPTTIYGGYFTFEHRLTGRTLAEIEGMLGFQKGRLIQGADFYVLEPPTRADQFEVVGTTAFSGEKLRRSNLYKSIDTPDARKKALSKFRSRSLMKVFPLEVHGAAFVKHLRNAIKLDRRDSQATLVQGPVQKYVDDLATKYGHSKAEAARIRNAVLSHNDIWQRVEEDMYPPAFQDAIEQYRASAPLTGRLICRMIGYESDVYLPI